TYTRGGLAINEGARITNWTIDYNFKDGHPGSGHAWSKDQCYASSVTIVDTGEAAARGPYAGQTDLPTAEYTQSVFGDKKIKVNITIVNNGNSPIYRLTYRFAINMGWAFFRDPTFFYMENGFIDYDQNVATRDILNISESFNMTIEVTVLKEIPIGEHRLPINYTGYYYNNGSLMTATGYEAINGTGNYLTVLFAIVVVDGALDCHWTTATYAAGTGITPGNYNGDLTELIIFVNITNDEKYNLVDVMVTADFTGTPFYNPLVTERATRGRLINAVQNPTAGWAPNTSLTVSFIVDEDPTAVPDRYRFSLNITAIIELTLKKTSAIVTPEISTIGYGPRISIEAFTAGDITPGLDFPLTLTIRNDGDDTLRDGWVFINAYSTEFEEWDPICDFIGQIQRENYTDAGSEYYAWDGAEVTLQQLDIDSAKEIIELNLYMNGVYNHPSARITLVRLREPLAPGQTVDVSFTMVTDKDMVKGKPYTIDVYITGKNSEGANGTGYTSDLRTITVRTKENGQSYQGVEWDWFSDGMKFFGLFLFLVIIIVILLMVFRKKGGKAEEHTHAEPAMSETPPAN
ncbi:MAG: hypothetical protein HZB92_06140, partial [Euryarchaeota archaeon]|nr:hypothetical protein [Euryarchaeota archaeon]